MLSARSIDGLVGRSTRALPRKPQFGAFAIAQLCQFREGAAVEPILGNALNQGLDDGGKASGAVGVLGCADEGHLACLMCPLRFVEVKIGQCCNCENPLRKQCCHAAFAYVTQGKVYAESKTWLITCVKNAHFT